MFSFLGEINLDGFAPGSVASWEKTPVPSAFDALPDYAGRRGAAVYRRTFSLPAGHPGRLEFGAVSMWCRIYVDGVACREHACGYAPFAVDVPASDETTRELLVLVDNRYDFERVPMHEEYFDFYQYGGILRSVTLRQLPSAGAFIDTVRVTPLADTYAAGEVEIAVFFGGASVPDGVELAFDGHAAVSRTISDAANPLIFRCHVPNPKTWSPEAPNLHDLTVRLIDADGHPDADSAYPVRFGLRHVEAREGALWLNGERLVLRGYNRHEWHPNFGPCTPELQMIIDLQHLRELGCNFVRGCHYPQDQQFLDLCDEFGMLVWEENLGWGQSEKTFESEKFRSDHAESLRAMVRMSWNHPSVIIWGILNEARTDRDGVRPVLEESVAIIRELDPSRVVSYATMFALTDRHYDLVDLIGLNLYPGWYGCEHQAHPLELIAPHYEECFAHLDAAGFADKPVIISETGAEALYGWRDPHNDFYTEEYQAAYLERSCQIALSHPRCSGIALWHFSDARTYSGGLSMKRPRTFNNKGTLDEYRRPKLAYQRVKACFTNYGN